MSDDIQESVDYLLETAAPAAQARANRIVLEHGLKRIKALAMQKARDEHERLTNSKAPLAVTLQERDAYASEEYGVALEGLREAIFLDEGFRARRDAHAAKIDAWRTQQATMRSVKL